MTITQRTLLIAALCAFLFYLLKPILAPFVFAMVLAYLGDPVTDWLETKRLSRTWAVVVVFSVMSLIALLVLLVVVPLIFDQVRYLVVQLPLWLKEAEEHLAPLLLEYFAVDTRNLNLDSVLEPLKQSWQGAGGVAVSVLMSISKSGMALIGAVVNLFLIPVVTFYLLRDWDTLTTRLFALLPRKVEPKALVLARECDDVLGAFLKGQLLVMVCLGVIYSVGLSLVGLKLALIIGLLAGLASIVPYMGFIVGIAAAILAAVLQFDTLQPLLWVGLVFAIGQVIEGTVLTPLLVGDRIGLHPVAVIFAILAGGQLFGFTGVLLALPVAAIIMVLLRHVHDGYLSSELYAKPAADGEPGEE